MRRSISIAVFIHNSTDKHGNKTEIRVQLLSSRHGFIQLNMGDVVWPRISHWLRKKNISWWNTCLLVLSKYNVQNFPTTFRMVEQRTKPSKSFESGSLRSISIEQTRKWYSAINPVDHEDNRIDARRRRFPFGSSSITAFRAVIVWRKKQPFSGVVHFYKEF